VAICDTNSDPDQIDFPIAANDDAIKSIRVITRELADAVYAARHGATAQELAGMSAPAPAPPRHEAHPVTEEFGDESPDDLEMKA